jgi:hypothetical protein
MWLLLRIKIKRNHCLARHIIEIFRVNENGERVGAEKMED